MLFKKTDLKHSKERLKIKGQIYTVQALTKRKPCGYINSKPKIRGKWVSINRTK